jgi:hypothetical protein
LIVEWLEYRASSCGDDVQYLLLIYRKILHQNGAVVGHWRLDILSIATICIVLSIYIYSVNIFRYFIVVCTNPSLVYKEKFLVSYIRFRLKKWWWLQRKKNDYLARKNYVNKRGRMYFYLVKKKKWKDGHKNKTKIKVHISSFFFLLSVTRICQLCQLNF